MDTEIELSLMTISFFLNPRDLQVLVLALEISRPKTKPKRWPRPMTAFISKAKNFSIIAKAKDFHVVLMGTHQGQGLTSLTITFERLDVESL